MNQAPSRLEIPLLPSNMMTCLCPTPGAELATSVLEDPFVHPSVVSSCSLHSLLQPTTHYSSPLLRPPKIPCRWPLRRRYLACWTEAAMIVMMMAWWYLGLALESIQVWPAPYWWWRSMPILPLGKDKTLSTSGFRGGYKAQTLKTCRPNNDQSSVVVEVPIPAHP